jgi:coenzyme F420 hydrogenase subunit beta
MFRLIYEESCTGCGNCVTACPVNVSLDVRSLGGKGGGNELRVRDGSVYVETKLCNGCGVCIQSCPFDALRLEVKEPKIIKKIERIFEEIIREKREKILEEEIRYEINEKFLQNLEVAAESFSTGILRRILEEEQEITPVEIRNLVEMFERHGNVFGILEEQIIARDFCSICGACAAACPEEAIEIAEIPHLVRECTSCASCLLRCPKTALVGNLEERIFGEKGEDLGLGVYKKAFSARSMKKEILQATEFGGAVTSLLIYALDEEIVDCAIITSRRNPILTSNPKEIIDTAGIKFAMSPNVSLLREAIKEGYKKIAFVGIPCHVIAARKFQLLGFKEIKLILGIFCPRGKREKGSPFACKLCMDFTAELSDISLGSVGSAKGWRSVLVRTELGEEMIKGVVRAGHLQISELGDGISKIAKLSKKKKEGAMKSREELLKKHKSFEEAVKSLGSLNVRYLSKEIKLEEGETWLE